MKSQPANNKVKISAPVTEDLKNRIAKFIIIAIVRQNS